MARLGRRERAAKADKYRIAKYIDAKSPVKSGLGRMRTMWDSNGVPFVKPGPRPWEYDSKKAVRIHKEQNEHTWKQPGRSKFLKCF